MRRRRGGGGGGGGGGGESLFDKVPSHARDFFIVLGPGDRALFLETHGNSVRLGRSALFISFV